MLLIGLVAGVIVARILGPSGRGTYYLAIALGGLITQFGNFGLHASNTYYVSRDRSLLPQLTANSLTVGAGFGLLAAVFLLLGSRLSVLPVDGPLALLLIPSIALGLVYMLLQNLLLGTGEVTRYNLIEIGQGLLGLVLISGVIFANVVRPETVFTAGVVATLVATLAAYRTVSKRFRNRLSISIHLMRRSFRYGAKAYVAALASYMVLRSDVVIIGYIVPPSEVGYYSIAVTMVDKLQILPITIGTLLFPRLAALVERIPQWQATRRVAIVISVIMVASLSAAALFARPIVALLYGGAFLPAVPSFHILLPGIGFLSINVIFMNYLAARGMPPVTFISPLVASALNIILNLFLVPRWGIEGAAWSSTLAYGSMLAFSLGYLRFSKNERP